MLKTRLIPVLLLKNGLLVRSELFSVHQIIGNPIHEVRRFNEWNVDELVYLDITRSGEYDLRRSDHKVQNLHNSRDILLSVSKSCFMPLTWGGGLRSIEAMQDCFYSGADKVVINTAAVETPELIAAAAAVFGSQAIVVSIDALQRPDGTYEVMTRGGTTHTGLCPAAWAHRVAEYGAGEILLQAVHRDGTGEGYDLPLITMVTRAVNIPVIACGGIGRYEQYARGITAGASAVAAANIWHFKELSDRNGKRALEKAGINIRR